MAGSIVTFEHKQQDIIDQGFAHLVVSVMTQANKTIAEGDILKADSSFEVDRVTATSDTPHSIALSSAAAGGAGVKKSIRILKMGVAKSANIKTNIAATAPSAFEAKLRAIGIQLRS